MLKNSQIFEIDTMILAGSTITLSVADREGNLITKVCKLNDSIPAKILVNKPLQVDNVTTEHKMLPEYLYIDEEGNRVLPNCQGMITKDGRRIPANNFGEDDF